MAAAYRAVEFYSGIGGMNYALKSCNFPVEVEAAIDINTIANEVYSSNFPETVLMNRNIEGIKLEEFIELKADIFTMSPPCQPFTRQGNRKASDDPRTKSFLHIMKVIRSLPQRPTYIFMENVKGFDVSETRKEFIKTLKETNYIYQEFLLSPTQFGIPNSRLRYFLVAVQKPLQLVFPTNESIMDCIPACLKINCKPCLQSDNPRLYCTVCNENIMNRYDTDLPNLKDMNERECLNLSENETCSKAEGINGNMPTSSKSCGTPNNVNKVELCSSSEMENSTQEASKTPNSLASCMMENLGTLQDFLEEENENFEEYLVPENILMKKVLLMDIVQRNCNHSCCFTKGYAHYVEGTGSVLQTTTLHKSVIFEKYCEANEYEKIQLVKPLGLRYFTWREIANILCFPKTFSFPKTISRKQKYRLLGNSLNVQVVRELMKVMFMSR